MIFLPYSDDIRGLEKVKQDTTTISRELLNISKILVNALTINDFDCANFEDPSLQQYVIIFSIYLVSLLDCKPML